MTLMLHTGAEPVPYDALRQLTTPEATATHVPIPHHAVVEMAKYSLGFYGHEIVEEHHAITPDGMRYFGLLSLRSSDGQYTDTLGLRNSHDKKFPIGIGFGSRVFVCDNLAFVAEHVIKRKHTVNAKRDMPGLVAEIIEPLAGQRKAQQMKFDMYRTSPLSDFQVDHAIMEMYRRGVINVQRIADVAREWEQPSYEGFEERTAWRLFNAATTALQGRTQDYDTPMLHKVIDGVCEYIH